MQPGTAARLIAASRLFARSRFSLRRSAWASPNPPKGFSLWKPDKGFALDPVPLRRGFPHPLPFDFLPRDAQLALQADLVAAGREDPYVHEELALLDQA